MNGRTGSAQTLGHRFEYTYLDFLDACWAYPPQLAPENTTTIGRTR
ncbi:hypothetical protein [Nocardia crassostreae]|nr:hypothetical protein [Nocardia crassostreae]